MYALSLTLSSVTPGCTDPGADNYDAAATVDDGSCTFPTPTPSPSLAAGVSATLALDMDINTIPVGSSERASFESSFRADVAARLGGISADRIVILGIQGSVTVDFVVLPATDGTALDESVVTSTFATTGVSVAGSATTSAVSNVVSTTPSLIATLALDMDINTIPGGSPQRASFESSFRADVAAQLGGISADRIVILSIQGSVTVDFAVLPADDGSALDPSVVTSTFAASGVSVAGSATTSAVSNIVSTTPAPSPSPSPAPAPTPPPSPPPGPVPENSKSQAAAAGQPVPKIYKGAVRPALSPSLLLHRHSQAVASTCHTVVGIAATPALSPCAGCCAEGGARQRHGVRPAAGLEPAALQVLAA